MRRQCLGAGGLCLEDSSLEHGQSLEVSEYVFCCGMLGGGPSTSFDPAPLFLGMLPQGGSLCYSLFFSYRAGQPTACWGPKAWGRHALSLRSCPLGWEGGAEGSDPPALEGSIPGGRGRQLWCGPGT